MGDRRRVVAQRDRGQDGQSLVEFAVVVPVFLLAMFGLFDVGRLVYTDSVLSQAAREGARLGAAEAAWIGRTGTGCVDEEADIGPANPGAHVCPPSVTEYKADVIGAANRMAVSLGPLGEVHVSCDVGTESDPAPAGAWTDAPGGGGNGCQDGAGESLAASGTLVSVRVEYTYQPMTPVIGSMMGAVRVSGSATMVIN
jgi:hypothetical protein